MHAGVLRTQRQASRGGVPRHQGVRDAAGILPCGVAERGGGCVREPGARAAAVPHEGLQAAAGPAPHAPVPAVHVAAGEDVLDSVHGTARQQDHACVHVCVKLTGPIGNILS